MKKIRLTSLSLHLLAMGLMLCDHLWATVLSQYMWLTYLGRAAFPIFAFLLTEGFYHTKSRKQYLLRMLIFAFVSEIPFDLMYGGTVFYPFHQNVMWSFLIALLCMTATEKIRQKKEYPGIAAGVFIFLAGALAGLVCMTDYFAFGILTVGVFYFFRGRTPLKIALQVFGLFVINVRLMGGMHIPLTFGGCSLDFPIQGLALLSMIPICLYNGNRGYHGKALQLGFYLFYPAHMLVLALIALYCM